MEVLFAFAAVFAVLIARLGFSWYCQARPRQSRQTDHEAVRREACIEVAQFLSDRLGYAAGLAIPRERLQEAIFSGISPDGLVDLIAARLEQLPGLVLGRHGSDLSSMPVKLPEALRERHVYVVGKSGSGKTTLLRHMALQDVEAGHGVGIIAPEQEMLLEEIIPFIPDRRIDDVIYFNPADLERPVCLNPLELGDGEDLDLRVDETYTIFSRILGQGGPRMDEIFRHTLYALTEVPGSTLLDVEKLLDRQDSSFRQEILRRLKDEQTKQFFQSTYLQLPRDAHLPIVNRIGRLTRAKFVRSCLCQPQGSLNIRQAMDEGRILLFNLSDGILGEAASSLLGQLIVSKFQLATMSRADVGKADRKPFYLYIDEFQAFVGVAASSYSRILSRARKYRLGLVLAHQQTGQIPVEVLREILGNVSTLISFQVSQSDAQKLAKEFVSEIDREILTLPPDELLRLRVGEAWCRIGQCAFPMDTEQFTAVPDSTKLRLVTDRSRERWGVSEKDNGSRDEDSPRFDSDESDGPPLEDLDPGKVF